MLNCISGMVEKTQRAISILQQRQAEAANVRSAEELVADIQTKASLAIMEVKQAALEEIKQAKQETPVQTKSKEEVRKWKNNKKYENKEKFYQYSLYRRVGTVADWPLRLAVVVAWPDIVDLSVNTKIGMITPGSADKTVWAVLTVTRILARMLPTTTLLLPPPLLKQVMCPSNPPSLFVILLPFALHLYTYYHAYHHLPLSTYIPQSFHFSHIEIYQFYVDGRHLI